MNESTTSFTFAGRNQRVILSLFRTQANLAAALTFLHSLIMLLDVLLDLKHSVCFIEVISVSDCMGIGLIFSLDDHIFDSS